MKEKCFADMDNRCYVLKNKKCENCKFYRADIDIASIERDIKLYEIGVKKNA